MISIPELGSCHFIFSKWRSLSAQSFEIQRRYFDIVSPKGKRVLRKYAIGYSNAENVPCKPKIGEIAVMFFRDGEYFWFHLRKNEFKEVFYET